MKSIASLVFLTLMALVAVPQKQEPVPQFSAGVRVWNKRDSVAHIRAIVDAVEQRNEPKSRKGNYERLFDDARRRVRGWEKAHTQVN